MSSEYSFDNLHKPMYFITVNNIENGDFIIKPFSEKWYLDSDYKELALLEGEKVLP